MLKGGDKIRLRPFDLKEGEGGKGILPCSSGRRVNILKKGKLARHFRDALILNKEEEKRGGGGFLPFTTTSLGENRREVSTGSPL